MTPHPSRTRSLAAVGIAGALVLITALPATASPAPPQRSAASLDRGLVAVATDEGVFLSWRLLAAEAGPATATGVGGPSFAVERDGERIAVVDDSTNYVDPDGSAQARYTVAPIWHDVTGETSDEVAAWAAGFYDLPLQKPEAGVTPTGEAFEYTANDASAADVDGDGALEFVVKWDPTNSKDVSQKGFTGTVYLDTYEMDGTLLNRLDLGGNIRAGAHYTQFMVYDYDGDGRAETILKTAPGTSWRTYGSDGAVTDEGLVTMPQEDLDAGYSPDDDYRMTAAEYREHLVGVFEGWSEHPEVVSGTWPATLEEAWGIPVEHEYPLTRQSAEELVDYFIDVYAPSRSARNDLTTFDGFIVDGPEYLTVFDATTGRELDTVRYEPGRDDDGLLWGDYAMSRIEPGNRVDRFLAGVAHLDDDTTTASAIFARGYYTRSAIAAYDWDGQSLTQRWLADSGHVPISNPFNDGPHGRDGSNEEYATLTTQGFHSLSASDVDDDGRQEVVYGAATLDDDGSLLYSSFDVLPEGSADPGVNVRLGHGDAMHVTDIDPERPGLEIWTSHEGATYAPYGSVLRDAATGEVLFGSYSGRDTGRAMIGDVRADVPGIEVWASMPGGSEGSGLLSATGETIDTATPGTNQSIRWAGDLTTQIVNGSIDQTPTIDDVARGTLLTAEGTRTNNYTKGNPSLVADVLGDWREELIVRTTDSSALRFYVSTEVTAHKLPTLLDDTQYRVEVARQNTSYNQPSYPGFYMASDMDFTQVPVATEPATPKKPRFIDLPGSVLDLVIIPRDRDFEYYIDGEPTRTGVTRVDSGAEVTVTAVPVAGVSLELEATSTWSKTFTTRWR